MHALYYFLIPCLNGFLLVISTENFDMFNKILISMYYHILYLYYIINSIIIKLYENIKLYKQGYCYFLHPCSFTTNKLAISSLFPSAPPQEIIAVPVENNDCVIYFTVYYRLKVFYLSKCLSNKV